MPWMALVAAGVGVAQSIAGGRKASKAREALENAKTPEAKQDVSVSRYYNEALRRYNTAPTSTAAYKNMVAGINRNQAAGLSSLKDRRSLIGGVSSIVGRSNDATLNASALAEREQANRFGVLGGASARKTQDDNRLFNQNELVPFNKLTSLYGMKAHANAQIMNTGISNVYSGLSNYAMMKGGTFGSGNKGASDESIVAGTPGLSNPWKAYGNYNTATDVYNQPPQ